jgi:hypothetical protein
MATTAKAPSSTGHLAPQEIRAWRGLLRVHASLSKALDAELEAEHGLPLTSYEVLMYLADAEKERMRMCDLAASVILSRSGLTRLVDRLEREGLLTRESCVSATHLAGVRALFLDHFGPEELEALAGYWERVVPGASSTGQASGSC